MTDINRVGIDLAKTVFHVTAVDEAGAVVERKRFRRAGLHSYLTLLSPGCVVAMEACGSAHHWARLALHLGHKVLMMSPHKVAPYTNANKNDVNDADGIVEPSGHAVRWGEVGRATASPAGASGAAVGGEGAHGTLQSKASDCLRNLVVTRLPVGVRH